MYFTIKSSKVAAHIVKALLNTPMIEEHATYAEAKKEQAELSKFIQALVQDWSSAIYEEEQQAEKAQSVIEGA